MPDREDSELADAGRRIVTRYTQEIPMQVWRDALLQRPGPPLTRRQLLRIRLDRARWSLARLIEP